MSDWVNVTEYKATLIRNAVRTKSKKEKKKWRFPGLGQSARNYDDHVN